MIEQRKKEKAVSQEKEEMEKEKRRRDDAKLMHEQQQKYLFFFPLRDLDLGDTECVLLDRTPFFLALYIYIRRSCADRSRSGILRTRSGERSNSPKKRKIKTWSTSNSSSPPSFLS